MPFAALLLREATPSSLSTLVAKSQHLPPPHPSYDLHLSPSQFSFTPCPETPDEGFESDTNSIVSNGSYETKTTETDSANGSTSSDSDTETPEIARRTIIESYHLVDCVCYNDVTYPDVLLFVIKNEALVFKFADLTTLRNFYVNFTAVKAVANQKVFNKNCKFNLLQRTDGNGVTHIEITRETEASFATPLIIRSGEATLRKVWSSADDLLSNSTYRTNQDELHSSSAPKRPERRKKSKAPSPPQQATPPPSPDVLRGEYVRVNVNTDTINRDFIAKSQLTEKKPFKSNLVTFLISKPVKMESQWTNSVPRLLKKQRSRSETRCFTPMAYRYIDTAPSYSPMGERLFGLSSKLKDFGGEVRECRWNSGGDLSCKEGNLKSVIKKDEGKKKNEKKVTFSAYTTVQVV